MTACGVLYVHAVPPALSPHVEWALAGVAGVPVALEWVAQPAVPGLARAEARWQGPAGTAGRLVDALRGWSPLWLEVSEDPSPGNDGERYALTPTLGMFRATTSVTGDVMLQEDLVRRLLAEAADATDLRQRLRRELGEPWDDELEPLRRAGEGAPVRSLTRVG